MSALTLDLTKSTQALKLSLEKRGVPTMPTGVEVAFDLDVSGSYEDEHLDGTTNALMARLMPWGMLFDPDKKLDVFTFGSQAHYVGDVTERDYDGYVRRNVIKKVPGWNSGTRYSDVLRLNLQHFGWIGGQTTEKRGGFLGFGRKTVSVETNAPKRRSLILFNTDGETGDERDTYRLFEEMRDKNYGVYVMFVAVSNQNAEFEFLQKLADDFDNCGITIIRDVRQWVKQSDDDLFHELITDELVTWLNG